MGFIACSVSKDYEKTSKEVSTYAGHGNLCDDASVVYPHEVEEHTVFEGRCWDEFWSNHPKQLKELEYKGFLSRRDMENEAIEQLFHFRGYWELYANNEGCDFILVSDNVSFDIGMIDQLMKQYKPITYPSIYRASGGTNKKRPNSNNVYNGGVPCTHSMQKGLLAVIDPMWYLSKDKGTQPKWVAWLVSQRELNDKCKPNIRSKTARIRYLYDIPKPDTEHDHNPVNDAFTIAHEYWAILLISNGHYTLNEDRVMKKRPAPEEEKHEENKKGKTSSVC
ncbi:MAG: hypothetical protein ACTSUE_08355 [Promethearchaeota archaeon]